MREAGEKVGYSNLLPQSSDSLYRVINYRFSYPTPLLRHQILVYESDFSLIDSIQLPLGVSLVDQPVKAGNKLYWSAGYTDSLNTNLSVPFKSAIVEMDTNFQFIALHPIGISSAVWYISKLVKSGTNLFISEFSGNSYISTLYKCNLSCAKVDSTVYPGSEIVNIFPYGDKFVALGYAFPGLPLSNGTHKLVIDSNLTVISASSLDSVYSYTYSNPNYLPHKIGISPNYNTRLIDLNNQKYFIASNTDLPYPVTSSYRLTVDAFFNHNDSVLKTIVESNIPENTCYTDNTVFSDFRNGSILKVSSIGFDLSAMTLYQTQNSFIRVVKMDTNGNIIWSKNHGGNMHFRPRSIIHTLDGGCLISGLRYDAANSPQPTLQSFLLKLDANGNFNLANIEESISSATIIKCFPNPVINDLYFDLPTELKINISIFDAVGRELIRVKYHKISEKIDVRNLNQGLYCFNLTVNHKMYSGKFIKLND
ncbi:MAG: T9SS type A sorting domain-containing protein [Bacteroidia bacterium]|nr:T9SS type A sorting domain-containing protein [Bacteroidia bacterium]